MKFITEVSDMNEFMRLRLLLETSGILIHVGNEDTARNYSFFHPVGKYAIHVIYDEQYNDAMNLLEDESHVVEHPMDVDEYKQHIERAKSDSLSDLLKYTIITCIVIALLLVFFLRLTSG